MSNSMYEIFTWGQGQERRPKQKFTLSLAGSSINIDDPAPIDDGSNQSNKCKKDKHVVFSVLDDDKEWRLQSIFILLFFVVHDIYHFSCSPISYIS